MPRHRLASRLAPTLIALAALAAPASAAETLSDSQMDEVAAGLLDITVDGSVNNSNGAGDNDTALTASTFGSNTVGTNKPVKIAGGAGQNGVAQDSGSVSFDNSDHSDHSNGVTVNAGGDAATAHSGGTVTIDKSNNSTTDNSDHSVHTTVGGAWTATGNGNSGDVIVAHDNSTASKTESLTLSGNVQQNAKALFLVNTLGQVGSGVNVAAQVDTAGGSIANLNTGVISTNQLVANFSSVVAIPAPIHAGGSTTGVGAP